MSLKFRAFAAFLVLAHPLMFGIYFCLSGMLVEGKAGLGTSLAGEVLAAFVCSWFIYQSIKRLSLLRSPMMERKADWVVAAAALLCLAQVAVNAVNFDTSGLFAKGGSRLDFYFDNDWFRRLVSFSFIPLVMANYYAINALFSPVYRNRRALFIGLLIAELLSSLLAGSKGSGILLIVATFPFVFTLKPLPILKIGAFLATLTSAYLALLLALTTNAYLSLINIARRFYLSIDISILLINGQGTAELLAGRLGDVWVEVFRSLGSLGFRVSEQPIGVMVYQFAFGTSNTIGSNCRFGALLLLYPDRLDFLLLYPLLVAAVTLLLGYILDSFDLPRAALVAMPTFAITAFQDAYWFASHFVPVIVLFGSIQAIKAINRGFIDRNPDPA
jgi:hypothetical protein